jgi:hypothetical protein
MYVSILRAAWSQPFFFKLPQSIWIRQLMTVWEVQLSRRRGSVLSLLDFFWVRGHTVGEYLTLFVYLNIHVEGVSSPMEIDRDAASG